jgi:hypothetical protein
MLIAAIGALTAVIGILWVALQSKISSAEKRYEDAYKAAEKRYEDDHQKLWELIKVVSQLDRRQQSALYADIIKGVGGVGGPPV